MAYSKKNMIEFVLLTEQLQTLDREHRELHTKYNNEMLESNKEIFELQTQLNYLKADTKDIIEAETQKAAEQANKAFIAEKLQLEDSILSFESKLKQTHELLKKEETTSKQLFAANANLESQLKIAMELADKKYEKVLDRALVDENFFKKLLEAQQYEASSVVKIPDGFVLIEEKKLKKLETDLVELQTSLEQERNHNEMLMLNIAEFEKKQKAFMSNFHSQRPHESGQFDSNFFKQPDFADPQAASGQEQSDRFEFRQSGSLADSKFFEMIGQPGNIEEKFRSNYHFNVQAEKTQPPVTLGVWFDVLYIKQGKVLEVPGDELAGLKVRIDELENALSTERTNRINESRLRAAADLRSISMESEKKDLQVKVETLKTEANSRAIHLSVVQEKLEFVKGLLSEMQAKEPKVVEIVKYIQSEPQQSDQKPTLDVTAEILRSLKSQQLSEQILADRQKIQALEQEIANLRTKQSQPTNQASLELQLADLQKLIDEKEQDIRSLRDSNQKLTNEIAELKQAAIGQNTKAEELEAEQFFDQKVPKFVPTESLSIEDLPPIQVPHPSTQQPQTVDSFVGFGAPMPNYRASFEDETASQRDKRLIGGVAIQRISSYDVDQTGVIDFVGAGLIAEDEEEVRPVNLGGNFGKLQQPSEMQPTNRPDILGSAIEQPKLVAAGQLLKSGTSNRPLIASITDPKEFERSFFNEFMGGPSTPQLPLFSHQGSHHNSYLHIQQSGKDSSHFEFLGSPKKEVQDSSAVQEIERFGEIKKTKTSPMENLRFDIQAIQEEARRENDPINKFDSTFGSSEIHLKVEADGQDQYLNVAESGVISSAKSNEQHKLQQMIRADDAPKLQEEDQLYENLQESGVITSAKDHQRDQFNNIFKSNRGHTFPTDMEESQVTSGAKDADQGKMQAMLQRNHHTPELPPLKHLNSIESQLAKKSETPSSAAVLEPFTQTERQKFENKIKFLQSKVKELEYKLSVAESGFGSSTPFTPYTHKSNRQQQDLLNRYSSYLNNKQLERPVSDRTIPRLRTVTSPLPSLPHLFQDKNKQQELDAEASIRPPASPLNLLKKTTIEIGLEAGNEGTENQETSRFNTYSHPKTINFSLFGKPDQEGRHQSQEDKMLQELMGEPEHEQRISQISKALAAEASKMIKEVRSFDQTPNEKNFLTVSGLMPGSRRLNKDAVGMIHMRQ